MSNDGEHGEQEMRLKGVRKRKWGRYVAEIRGGKRSRISLGSYFTGEAAARAYDTALLCLRGPSATSFNFPDSKFNLEVANVERNPSPHAIRTAAIRVGSLYDVVPSKYFVDNNDEILEEAPPANGVVEGTYYAPNSVVEQKIGEEEAVCESSERQSLVESSQHTLPEESIRTFDLMTSFG